jgi:hypothetical protein
MKKGKTGPLVPAQSLALLALCGAGIVGFLLLVILPADRASAELDREIAALTARVEEQKVLSPVFKTLFEKTRSPLKAGGTAPARTKLSRADIAALPRRLQDMAATHRLAVREVVPDINTLTDASGRLSMKIHAQGQFADLRGWLLDIGALPFFDGIEEMDIRAVEGGGEEATLKVWLARE